MRPGHLETFFFRTLQNLSNGGRIPVVVALGSNLGDRQSTLQKALDALAPLFSPLKAGPWLESEPWGPVPQPRFLNTVALGWTLRSPWEILHLLKTLERKLGRQPGKRWGPRVVDLDLVFYGTLRMRTPTLMLPHPRYLERGFVLQPLLALLERLGYQP